MCGMLKMKMAAMLVLALAAGATRAEVETAVVDGMTYTYFITSPDAFHPEITSKFATIVKAQGGNKSVVIPSTLGGATVRTLSGSGFLNNTTVMKVTIPETVNYLDCPVFSGCIALTSCNIPSGVTALPDACFYGCTKLRAVTLPKGLKSIGSSAFSQCLALSAIDLPDGLTSIGDHAFDSCSSLTRVIIPDSVTSVGSACFMYCSSLVSAHLPTGLTSIPGFLFYYCTSLKDVNIPAGVTSVGEWAFCDCSSLKEITLPAGVTSVGECAFVSTWCRVIFQGKPPAGLPNASMSQIVYPKEYGALYQACFSIAQTGGLVNPNKPVVTIVSSGVRKNNPTVLDVVYKVTSTKPTVKVRALAFEDGERSFAKVTRPETFIEGTAANIGDAIAANEEHTLSWQVSTDFKTDLAKMKFEVLAIEDDVLPLELMTIPANGSNKAMEVSWNLIIEAQYFDALMWLYAAKAEGLTLENGVLKNGTMDLAERTWLCCREYYSPSFHYGYPAISFVFTQMGYSVLSGDALTYANEMTRLGLSPDDWTRQYAYRWIEE